MLNNILNLFKKEKSNSKESAKNRLTLILAHERTSNIPFIDDLKRDIMEVIQKYNKEPEDVVFKTSENRDMSALEIEIKM
jgi:cell division topological specificity factor